MAKTLLGYHILVPSLVLSSCGISVLQFPSDQLLIKACGQSCGVNVVCVCVFFFSFRKSTSNVADVAAHANAHSSSRCPDQRSFEETFMRFL